MKTRNTNLKVMQKQDEEKERRQPKGAVKLRPGEVAERVGETRRYLEGWVDRLAGLSFDFLNSDTPASIDYVDPIHPCDLAESLTPGLAADYERLYAEIGPAADELTDFKMELAETAFAIGVLAGAVFHGASERDVERLQRGLTHATCSRQKS